MAKFNVAVIGVGSMGRNHARVYSELENAKLVAVSDIDEKTGIEISRKFGCKYYKDYRKMLESEKLDAVSVAVPTKMHTEIALDVIKRGVNLLIEKPIADNISNAKKIVELAVKKSVKLSVGHVERFNPAVKKLKEIIGQGMLGEVTSVIARRVGLFPPRVKDANVVIDLAVHDIDIINYLLGKTPSSVHANLGATLTSEREDHAEIFMKYGNASGFVQVNWISPIKIRTLSVTGTKGYAELNYITQELIFYESNYTKDFDSFGEFVVKFGTPEKVVIEVKKEEPLKLELKAFLECIEKNKEPEVTGKDALKVLEIALSAVMTKEGGKAHDT